MDWKGKLMLGGFLLCLFILLTAVAVREQKCQDNYSEIPASEVPAKCASVFYDEGF